MFVVGHGGRGHGLTEGTHVVVVRLHRLMAVVPTLVCGEVVAVMRGEGPSMEGESAGIARAIAP